MKSITWKLCILVGTIAVSACADGQLDNQRNRYRSIYGFELTQPGSRKGAIIGRLLQTDAAPGAWARIYAQALPHTEGKSPSMVVSNEKGGFYLGELERGSYRLLVMSPTGQGASEELTVAAGAIVERDQLQLTPLVRLYGQVILANEPVLTGSKVLLPGTPFSTATNHEGAYFLDVPRGKYFVRAERELFQMYESKELVITDDTEFNIKLQSNPWPSGKVAILNSVDGYIVRGHTTSLQIVPDPGVRYMRVRREGVLQAIKGTTFNIPQPIQKELVLEVATDHASFLSFEFMDAYGRLSQPVEINFYNVNLDESWRIIYGIINEPTVFRSGEKIKFLSDGCCPVLESKEDGSITTSDSKEPSSLGTYFDSPVIIEAGVELQGSATFGSTLNINGTLERPVIWNGKNGRSLALESDASFNFLKLSDLGIDVMGESLTVDHSSFKNFDLNAYSASATTQVRASDLDYGRIRHYCNSTNTAVALPNKELLRVANNTSSILDLERNALSNVTLDLYCRQEPSLQDAKIRLIHNNFFDLPLSEYYLRDYFDSEISSDHTEFTAIDNHFREPSRLYQGMSTWPVFFGPNIEQAWTDVGSGLTR